MKILYVCADAGIPIWGFKGGSIHIREFVTHLQAAGHEVTVVARSGGGDGPRNQVGFDVIGLPKITGEQLLTRAHELGGNPDLLKDLKAFSRNEQITRLLRRLHGEHDFDFVYERYSLFSIAGLEFARRCDLPFLLEVNAPLSREASQYRSLSFRGLAEATEEYLFENADLVLTVSAEVRDFVLQTAPAANAVVVPNGVSLDRFSVEPDPSAVSSYLGQIADSPFIVGFVGRLRPWHGVDNLMKAFLALQQRYPDSGLLIVGDEGGMKAELEAICPPDVMTGNVVFTGPVAHDAVAGLLQRMDVVTAPYPETSEFYFSALKIFEYMAAARPIVASAIGQLTEVLEDERTALLTPPGDVAALTGALIRLREQPELARKLAENARAEAQSKHSWGRRIDQVMGELEKLGGIERAARGARA